MNEGKPLSMLCEEFRNAIANTINNSQLPAYIIEPILKNYWNDVRAIAKQQYETEKANFENQISINTKSDMTGCESHEIYDERRVY